MLRFKHWGLPCWSSGWESMLPMQGVRVWSLVGELRSRKPGGVARKEKKKKKTLKLTYRNSLIKTKENSYGKKKDLNTEDSVLSSPSPRLIFLTKRLIPLNSTLEFVLFLTFN